jgi:hypothetical protein
MTAVQRASAAFPQFQVDEALPEAMIELLARLEQSSGQDPDVPANSLIVGNYAPEFDRCRRQ